MKRFVYFFTNMPTYRKSAMSVGLSVILFITAASVLGCPVACGNDAGVMSSHGISCLSESHLPIPIFFFLLFALPMAGVVFLYGAFVSDQGYRHLLFRPPRLSVPY